jgi:ABC-type lipoprotein export system ATPase subunit
VILADEPTGALDTHTSEEVMGILESLVRERGITVILVTHEQDVANYADRIIRMRDGKILEDAGNRTGMSGTTAADTLDREPAGHRAPVWQPDLEAR